MLRVRKSKVDLAVVGSGPAGLAAAIRARESGLERVVVLERAERPGGILLQCIHTGFGLQYFGDDLTGPEYSHRFVEKARDLGVDFLLDTTVTELSPEKRLVAVGRDGLNVLEPGAVVLAMGCRERTRAWAAIPGSRPAGIFMAGTAQRLINVEGYLPGRRVVILGSGDIGMIMARRLTLEGCQVEVVVEMLPYPSGSPRNEVQCLRDFGIPLLLEHTAVEVHGSDRVEGVTIARLDQERRPVPGTERRIDCDTLLLSVGLVPENELSTMAGIELDPLTGGPLVDERMETSLPGVFGCGNVVHVHDLVDYVTWAGEAAGEGAAAFVQGSGRDRSRRIRVKAGPNVRYVVPHTVSGGEDVTIYLRVAAPEDDVELLVGDGVMRRRFSRVRPSEMLILKVPASCLEGMNGEMQISCVRRRKSDA
ncbi:MAG: NAD(P)/FAD-dependent oxidoreductase [Dehalococcoidia bacterium]|nr:NAD(P)/FAD-dependent oxidoreductase [Dehalococcoidia bacterium]